MTKEFERARDDAADKFHKRDSYEMRKQAIKTNNPTLHFKMHEEYYKAGANWAYEWMIQYKKDADSALHEAVIDWNELKQKADKLKTSARAWREEYFILEQKADKLEKRLEQVTLYCDQFEDDAFKWKVKADKLAEALDVLINGDGDPSEEMDFAMQALKEYRGEDE